MPVTRQHRFALATGCNLLAQYLERQTIEKRKQGRPTQDEETTNAADLCLAAWGLAA